MANPDPEILAKASQWVSFADDDLKLAFSAMDLQAEDTPYRLIAYHAQQCAEKYIKAFLVYCGVDFPYTHNIRRLLKLCSQHADWPAKLRDAEELTAYAITARHPGEDEEVTKAEAIRAIELARQVRTQVRTARRQIAGWPHQNESMTRAKKIDMWRRWHKRIGHDLGSLLTAHDVFQEIQSIVKSNRNIQFPTLFYRWLCDNYSARAAVALRRLSDHGREIISLYRLIGDISKNPDTITLDYFISRDPDLGKHDFDRFADKGSKLISVSKLERDKARLEKETNRIRKFVDKWIAHCDRNRPRLHAPTYKEVGKALNHLDELYCKYSLLIRGASTTTCKTVIHDNWKEPLRHPWIEMTEEQKQRRLKRGLTVWDKRAKT